MASVNYRLDHPFEKGTRDLKGTPVPILVELYITNEFRPEISTGEKILPKHWNNNTRRAKPSMTGHLELNDHLDTIRKDLLQVWRENKSSDGEIIKEKMRIAVKGSVTVQKKTTDENPVIAAALKWFDAYQKANVKGSHSKPRAMIERLKEFSKEHDLSFNALDKNFPAEFREFVISRPVRVGEDGKLIWPNPQYPFHRLVPHGDYYLVESCPDFDVKKDIPVPIMNDTIEKYLTNLITFLYWAEDDYPVNPKFQKWQLIRSEAPVIRLTAAELERLESTEMPIITLPVNEKKKINLKIDVGICRDYLVAECRTGQRISDLQAVEPGDFHGMNWTVTQKKGNRLGRKTRTIPFDGYTLPAYLIFQKYGFRMPRIPEYVINIGIKHACKLAGIDQQIFIDRWAGNRKIRIAGPKYAFLSSHTGRKTFVSLMLSMPGVSDATVMYLTGITSYKTLKRYKDDIELPSVTAQLKTTGEPVLMKKAN